MSLGLLGILVVLSVKAWPALKQFGLHFFTSADWDPVSNNFSALSSIYGTIVTSLNGSAWTLRAGH